MFKALLKKQFYELFRMYFLDRKTGKKRSKGSIIAYFLLFAFVFLCIGFMFFGVGTSLYQPLLASGMEWLYYAIMGLFSITLGLFGSVFNTYASLFMAKDNELLLSMPIPPMKLLAVRMTSVVAMSVLYSAIVWLPAIIVPLVDGSPSILSIVNLFLLLPFLSLFVTVFTCLLGWLVALIASRLRNKSLVIVILSLTFFVAYYYGISQINQYLQLLIVNSEEIGAIIKVWLFPIYQLALGATGNPLSMLFFCALSTILALLCCFVLSRSFLKIATTNRGLKKVKYEKKALHSKGALAALVKKDFTHFYKSPIYMMNTGLGLALLPILGIVSIIKSEDIQLLLPSIEEQIPSIRALLPVAICAAVLSIVSMNGISAPSISLEGKNCWILQSMPLEPWKVLRSKELLHVSLNGISVVISLILLAIGLKLNVLTALLIFVTAMAFCWLTADLGLISNLKKPMMVWTTEAIPVKQSISVLIVILVGWLAAVGTAIGYYFLQPYLHPNLFLGLLTCLFLGLTLAEQAWLNRKGCQIFAEL